MAPAILCKRSKNNQNLVTRGKSNEIKSKFACILEASESTRLRMGESLPNYHENQISGKGENSLQQYNLVHKFIPMPQAMKIPAAKAAVDKEWEKLEKISAWNLTKVKSKKEVIDEARTKGAKVHFASLMDICHKKNDELETKHQKYKSRVVLQTFGFVYHDTNGQNHGPVWKTQSFLLSGICTVILWQDCYGKGNLRKSYRSTVGRRFPIGNVSSYTVKKDYSYLCMWMT